MPKNHLDHWIASENVARFQRLIDEATDEVRRAELRKLLADAIAQEKATRLTEDKAVPFPKPPAID